MIKMKIEKVVKINGIEVVEMFKTGELTVYEQNFVEGEYTQFIVDNTTERVLLKLNSNSPISISG